MMLNSSLTHCYITRSLTALLTYYSAFGSPIHGFVVYLIFLVILNHLLYGILSLAPVTPGFIKPN